MQFNFVLGVSGCTPATGGNLDYLVKQIPAGSTWTVTGIGRGAWPMAAAGIVMGGNVRVGFEDNIYLEGPQAASNGELVDKVVRLAKELGREIATPTRPARSCPGLIPHSFSVLFSPQPYISPQPNKPIQNRRNVLCRRKATSTALTASSSPRAC